MNSEKRICSGNGFVSAISKFLKIGSRNKSKRKRVISPVNLIQTAVEVPAPAIMPSARGGLHDITNHVRSPTAEESETTTPPARSSGSNSTPTKQSPKDYIFGKVIGEGSFSTVYLAKDVHHSKEYAIKVCEKRHILKEKKAEYVKRERDILNLLSANHCKSAPFFVKLYSTFQDDRRLYFVMTYAKNGELLSYITEETSFDINCTKFYSGEIVRALEHLHSVGIIHRDLKPENILLDEKMHILIADFGSAKVLPVDWRETLGEEQKREEQKQGHQPSDDSSEDDASPSPLSHQRCKRRNSFVGTAQYVSPELLTGKIVLASCDLWALGCVMYQMVARSPPFVSRSEYMIFQKIMNLDYTIPEVFDPKARDLVEKLLVLEPSKRLGAAESGGKYMSVRSHPFFEGIDFDTLYKQTPPPMSLLTEDEKEDKKGAEVPDHLEPGLDERQLTRLLELDLQDATPLTDDLLEQITSKKD